MNEIRTMPSVSNPDRHRALGCVFNYKHTTRYTGASTHTWQETVAAGACKWREQVEKIWAEMEVRPNHDGLFVMNSGAYDQRVFDVTNAVGGGIKEGVQMIVEEWTKHYDRPWKDWGVAMYQLYLAWEPLLDASNEAVYKKDDADLASMLRRTLTQQVMERRAATRVSPIYNPNNTLANIRAHALSMACCSSCILRPRVCFRGSKQTWMSLGGPNPETMEQNWPFDSVFCAPLELGDDQDVNGHPPIIVAAADGNRPMTTLLKMYSNRRALGHRSQDGTRAQDAAMNARQPAWMVHYLLELGTVYSQPRYEQYNCYMTDERRAEYSWGDEMAMSLLLADFEYARDNYVFLESAIRRLGPSPAHILHEAGSLRVVVAAWKELRTEAITGVIQDLVGGSAVAGVIVGYADPSAVEIWLQSASIRAILGPEVLRRCRVCPWWPTSWKWPSNRPNRAHPYWPESNFHGNTPSSLHSWFSGCAGSSEAPKKRKRQSACSAATPCACQKKDCSRALVHWTRPEAWPTHQGPGSAAHTKRKWVRMVQCAELEAEILSACWNNTPPPSGAVYFFAGQFEEYMNRSPRSISVERYYY
jgi:hypothetical protein